MCRLRGIRFCRTCRCRFWLAFRWWSRMQGAFRVSMCLLKYFIIRKIWAFPCALSLCSVAPGRYVTGSAFAPASALAHFIRSLAVAAFGALHSANALLIVEKSKYLTYNNLMNTAILSSFDKYTTFSFGGKTLTLRTCNGLERYTKVFRINE